MVGLRFLVSLSPPDPLWSYLSIIILPRTPHASVRRRDPDTPQNKVTRGKGKHYLTSYLLGWPRTPQSPELIFRVSGSPSTNCKKQFYHPGVLVRTSPSAGNSPAGILGLGWDSNESIVLGLSDQGLFSLSGYLRRYPNLMVAAR